ncbi:MAG: hypothetical protein WD673_03740 [Alphaproteobacteria bacterium]
MIGRHGLAGLAAALLLGSCGGEGVGGPVVCPAVLVVADAATVTEYRDGPGRDLTDVRFSAGVADVNWACEYDGEGHVDVEIAIDLVASRGPAADAPTARFAYFVVLADQTRAIRAKKVFPFEITFEGNVASVGFRRVAGTTFYVGEETTGSGYTIFIGFQLTRDQYRHNLGGG